MYLPFCIFMKDARCVSRKKHHWYYISFEGLYPSNIGLKTHISFSSTFVLVIYVVKMEEEKNGVSDNSDIFHRHPRSRNLVSDIWFLLIFNLKYLFFPQVVSRSLPRREQVERETKKCGQYYVVKHFERFILPFGHKNPLLLIYIVLDMKVGNTAWI